MRATLYSTAQTALSGTILLVQDHDDRGYPAYYFLRVNRGQKPRFLRHASTDAALDLRAYGEILYSAYGEEPSPQAITFMREHHGWSA